MNNAFKNILKQAKDKQLAVKLFLKYPGANRSTLRSGEVLDVDEETVTIKDIYEGMMVIRLDYLMDARFKGGINVRSNS